MSSAATDSATRRRSNCWASSADGLTTRRRTHWAGAAATWPGCCENRLLLQGRAVVHDRIALPAALFRGMTEKRLRERPATLYRLYQDEFAITVVRAVERARAVAADRATARVLGVPRAHR